MQAAFSHQNLVWCLLDVVPGLDVRRLCFILYLEFLIDDLQFLRDFRFGNCDLFLKLGI